MDVTTINITTVGLSNTESEVNYESDQFANQSSELPLHAMMWWWTSHSNSVLSEPCGKVSHHTAHQLDLPREPYVRTGLEKQVRSPFPLPLKCTASAVL